MTKRNFDNKCRKCCPVCYIHKVYEGPVCPSCKQLGYARQPDGKKIKRVVKKEE